LFLDFRSLRLNGVPVVEGGFIQPLVTAAVSTRLREDATEGSDRPYDVLDSVKTARMRYGCLDEGGVMRTGFGLEDEVVGMKARRKRDNDNSSQD
jgi:hypothetical protein